MDTITLDLKGHTDYVHEGYVYCRSEDIICLIVDLNQTLEIAAISATEVMLMPIEDETNDDAYVRIFFPDFKDFDIFNVDVSGYTLTVTLVHHQNVVVKHREVLDEP